MSTLAGNVTVVSPHLDDAAFSIGATIARAVHGGAGVLVVTVLAGDPTSAAPAAAWDRACGFDTVGAAARGRRQEDDRACAALGARPFWLSFGDSQYEHERGADDDQVWAELEPHLAEADLVLLPGFPLLHGDHAWVTELVAGRLGSDLGLAFFVEQPYAARAKCRPSADTRGPGGREVEWKRQPSRLTDRHAKGRACRAYRSQFGGREHLERRLLLPELLPSNELVGWPLRV
ncbi:MAG: PIG-L deacetylase family protein [Gaiellaceae bacterium]